jgi:Domain of unknown function (DU1801)
MKTTSRKKAKTWYVKDQNPELGKVAAALRKFETQSVAGVKETANSWGVPTFETDIPLCMYTVGKNHVTFGFHYGTSLADPEGLLRRYGKEPATRETVRRGRFGAERSARAGGGGFAPGRPGPPAGHERQAAPQGSAQTSGRPGRLGRRFVPSVGGGQSLLRISMRILVRRELVERFQQPVHFVHGVIVHESDAQHATL